MIEEKERWRSVTISVELAEGIRVIHDGEVAGYVVLLSRHRVLQINGHDCGALQHWTLGICHTRIGVGHSRSL